MARKKSMKSLRRNLIEEIYNSTPMPAQEPQADYTPSFNSGMSRDEIANIYNSYEPQNQEIPKLEQNTTPTPSATTPSITDELERMKKAKADTTTPRTEGEQKAIDTYYNSLVDATKSAPKQSVPKQTTPDYRSEIQRMNQLKSDTTTPRTEGENQAIDTYLASLEEAQRYVDSQKPKTTVKKAVANKTQKTVETPKKNIGTIEIKSDGTKKYTKTMSPNEQRDYERALMAQSKARGRALSPNEQRDYERAQEAIAKAKEREKVTTEEKIVNAPVSANNNTENITYGRIKQESAMPTPENRNENAYTLVFDEDHPDGYEVPVYAFEDEKEARKKDFMNQTGMSNAMANPQEGVLNNLNSYDQLKHAALAGAYYGESEDKKIDRYLDPNTKLNKKERKDAKKIVKEYYKENPKAKKAAKTNIPNEAMAIVNNMTPEEKEEYARMAMLSNKTSPLSSYAQGILGDVPFLENMENAVAKNTGIPEQYDWTAMKQNAQRQNPLLYTGGNATRIMAEYGALSPYLESIPALARFTNSLGTAAAGGDAIVGSKIGSVLRGTLADALLTTAPREINNVVNNGYGVADVAADAFEDLTENTLWNMIPEFGPDAIKKLKGANNADIPKVDMPTPVEMVTNNDALMNKAKGNANNLLVNPSIPVVEEAKNIQPEAVEQDPFRWGRTADSIIPADSYARKPEFTKLEKDIAKAFDEEENLKSQIDELEKQLKAESFEKPREDWDGNDEIASRFFKSNPVKYTEKGQAILDEIKGKRARIDELEDNIKLLNEERYYIKANERLSQLEKYTQSGFVPATREKYQGFSTIKGNLNDDLKNGKAMLVEMTPDEYINRCVYEIFKDENYTGSTLESVLSSREQANIDKYAKQMLEGVEFDTPYLDYTKAGQEGLHRALAAKEAGIDVMPVVVKGTPYDLEELGFSAKRAISDINIERSERELKKLGYDPDELFDEDIMEEVGEDIAKASQPEVKPEIPQEPKGRDIPEQYRSTLSPEERARQNLQKVSQKVEPVELATADVKGQKAYIKDFLKDIEMPKETRVELEDKLKNLDEIMNKFNNATSKKEIMESMEELEKLYDDVESSLKGKATVVVRDDNGIKESKNAFKNAMAGRTINLSPNAAAGLTDTKLKEINNLLYSGPNSGRFVKNGGAPLDTVFDEINSQTGNALSNYMESIGLNPDVMEDQAQGIVEYARFLKGQKGKVIREDAYEGGLLDDVFEHMIKKAGERGFNIDENELRKNKYVTAFRTHNQGQLGLTDEELNNKYFNTQNENLQFIKGDRGEDLNKATYNLETDYDGTVNNILNKPLNEILTPQEFDEGMMAFNKEINEARKAGDGDFQKGANLFYRMAQDTHKVGAALQARVAWKKNTPVGVLYDAVESARKMAVEAKGEKFVEDIDNLVRKFTKVVNNPNLSFEEMEREARTAYMEMVHKGYKGGIDGYEEMKKLLETGKLNRDFIYENLKKAGRIVTEEDWNEMLKTGKVNRIVEDLNKVGYSVTVDDFNEMLKTGKLTKEKVLEDLKKAGKIVSKEDWDEMLKTGKLNREMVLEDLKKVGHSVTMEDVNKMLDSCKNVDEVSIRDLLYAKNKIPNLDVRSQKQILDIVEDMYAKELSNSEKQKYINKINMILSKQKHWSIKDKAIEIMHMMMLSGLKTHEKNILANTGILPQQALARKLSALGQNGYALINKDYKPTQAFFVGKDARKLAHEALEQRGGAQAIVEGITDKYSNQLVNQIGPTYMFGVGKKNLVSKANDFLTNKIPVLEKAEKKISNAANAGLKKIGSEGAYGAMDSDISLLENARQLIYGSLGGLEDNPFVKRNFEDRLASYIQAQKIKNLSEIPQEAIDLARAEAIKATFKDTNSITEAFDKFKKLPVVGETMLPFTKTPANLLARSIDYSPIGAVREIYGNIIAPLFGTKTKWTRDTVGEVFDELSKSVSGTLFGTLGLMLYANDVITGKEDPDYNMARYMSEEGWKPYSVSAKGLSDFFNKYFGTNLDLGDGYYPFDWLQPSTTNIIAMEEMYDELTDGKKITEKSLDDYFARAKSITGSYVSSLLNQSTMKNISELFGSKYNTQDVGENFADSLLEMPTRFFSGAINDIAKLEDTTKREVTSKNKPVETVFNQILSKTPGMSDLLPAKYDLFGNEVKTSNSTAENIFKTFFDVTGSSSKNPDKHYDYIDRLNESTNRVDYVPVTPARSLELDDGTKKPLDNWEYSRLKYTSGKERGRLIDNADKNWDYHELSSDEKAYVLGELDKVALAKGDKTVASNAKISSDVQDLLDMTDDERISFLADKAKKNTAKKYLTEKGLPTTDFFVEEYQSGEDMNKWKPYAEIINKAEVGDSEGRRTLFEKGYLEKALEYGLDGYDSKSAMKAFKDGEYENYAGYREELQRTGMKDDEKLWDDYIKQIHSKGEADLTNVKTIAPEQQVSVQQELAKLGMPDEIYSVQKYDRAKREIPELTTAQFVTTYNSIDSKDKKNNSISQKEIIAYLNDTKVKDENKGLAIWNAYLTNSTESTIPVLEDGKWKTKSK